MADCFIFGRALPYIELTLNTFDFTHGIIENLLIECAYSDKRFSTGVPLIAICDVAGIELIAFV